MWTSSCSPTGWVSRHNRLSKQAQESVKKVFMKPNTRTAQSVSTNQWLIRNTVANPARTSRLCIWPIRVSLLPTFPQNGVAAFLGMKLGMNEWYLRPELVTCERRGLEKPKRPDKYGIACQNQKGLTLDASISALFPRCACFNTLTVLCEPLTPSTLSRLQSRYILVTCTSVVALATFAHTGTKRLVLKSELAVCCYLACAAEKLKDE